MLSQGIDLIETERINGAIERFGDRFLHKIYTPYERELCDRSLLLRVQRYATYWAVKEATMKALGTGYRKGVIFRDIETRHESSGKPYLILYGRSKEIAEELGVKDIAISMSHLENIAVAIVTFELDSRRKT